MSAPLCDVKKLQLIEATLHVETRGATTTLRVLARGENSMFFVRMPTTVWREFCKRQISVPPPLPVIGGQL
jgi:hypothetical protein